MTSDLSSALLSPAEAVAIEIHGHTKAGVLVPIYERDGDLTLVFTRRRPDLRHHAGEISFPGGRRDSPDEPLDQTALREAEEEIGLAPKAVTLLGALTPLSTFVSGFAVYPFVGLIEPAQEWDLNSDEVAEVIELPLKQLAATKEKRRLLSRGVPIATVIYPISGDDLIWGATARIVSELLERVGGPA